VRVVVLIALVGCGRVSFDPLHDGATDGESQGDSGLDAVASSDLLFHFPFDTGYTDVARGHPSTCVGGCAALTAGHVGTGSVIFNGSQCINIPDAADLHPSTFTFMLWVAMPVPSGNVELMSRPFNGDTSPFNMWEIWAQPDSQVVMLANGVQYNATGLNITLWHHYAAAFDGTTLVSFVDGAPIDTRPSNPTNYSTDPYLIGCDLDNATFTFFAQGNFDDVRFYGRALATAEVAAIAADHF